MNAPQIVMIVLLAIGGTSSLAQHGQHYKKPINFWGWCVSASIVCGVLWWGGFWQ